MDRWIKRAAVTVIAVEVIVGITTIWVLIEVGKWVTTK